MQANNVQTYAVESSILVLRVDLLDVIDDVIIQCLAEKFVMASEETETQLEQRRRRNETFTS